MRRAEREQERQQRQAAREAELRRKRAQKEYEKGMASLEVRNYEHTIKCLEGIGRKCGEIIDWEKVAQDPGPTPPSRTRKNEESARRALEEHAPGFFTRMFELDKKVKAQLRTDLKSAISRDERDYENAARHYETEFSRWEDRVELAHRVLEGNLEAFEEVIREVGPFGEIAEVGGQFKFVFSGPQICQITLDVRDSNIVPIEALSLTSTGKLSRRKMPVGRGAEIYQDYVCGSLFRLAREMFALLPTKFVICSAFGDVLNTATGMRERVCLCSAGFHREDFRRINFRKCDFSDALDLFRHRAKFTKKNGFAPVEPLSVDDFDLSSLSSETKG